MAQLGLSGLINLSSNMRWWYHCPNDCRKNPSTSTSTTTRSHCKLPPHPSFHIIPTNPLQAAQVVDVPPPPPYTTDTFHDIPSVFQTPGSDIHSVNHLHIHNRRENVIGQSLYILVVAAKFELNNVKMQVHIVLIRPCLCHTSTKAKQNGRHRLRHQMLRSGLATAHQFPSIWRQGVPLLRITNPTCRLLHAKGISISIYTLCSKGST